MVGLSRLFRSSSPTVSSRPDHGAHKAAQQRRTSSRPPLSPLRSSSNLAVPPRPQQFPQVHPAPAAPAVPAAGKPDSPKPASRVGGRQGCFSGRAPETSGPAKLAGTAPIWACAKCTLHNDLSDDKCVACLTPKPRSTNAVAAVQQEQAVQDRLVQLVDDGILSRDRLSTVQRSDVVPQTLPGQDPFHLDVPSEHVTKHWYDWPTKQWRSAPAEVKIDWQRPIAEGNLRVALRMIDVNGKPGQRCCAAKYVKAGRYDGDQRAYVDVEMQEACRAISRAFNARGPPKPVTFLDCWVIKREGPSIAANLAVLAVEPYIDPSSYVKHNNNYGFVLPNARNTPQAFSHFTWEHTQAKLMIVDIQGVGDVYTDPQIHTADGQGFGQGNCGRAGIAKFLQTHRCNPICQMLRLRSVNPHDTESGTCPRGAMAKPGQAFQVGDFVRDLRPIPNTPPVEDLSMLDLTMEKFNVLAKAFSKHDTRQKGFLVADQMFDLLQDLGFQFTPPNVERLLSGLEKTPNATMTFKQFLLWYRGMD